MEGQPLPRLRSRKSLWLLALLVLRQGWPVEREWLAETLWPDSDLDQSLTSLRTVLSELRQALGHEGGRLQSPNRHSLCLELGGMSVDLLEFDAAKSSRDPAVLKQAVAVYRGPLLEGCIEEWVAQERLVREKDCLRVLQTLADAALAAGEFETAASYYRQAVGIDPWRESAQRGLMQALSASGDSNAALTVYQTLTRLLRKDDPRASPDEQTTALYTSLRSQARRWASQPPVVEAVPPPAVTGYVPHSLTDLIGREEEREVVAERLRRFRLVTLTGPGGIGKTRLALAVASEVAAEYADGVWLVSLESLSEGTQVGQQIVSVLGLKEEPERSALQTLTAFLRPKRLLLVLDNCEHLLEASARVAAHLLGDCAGVQILATSREPLGLTGEGAWAVPGLSVPDPAAVPHLLTEYESVRLFVERAQAVNPQFALTESSGPAVATICTRLEGIPLAIELAAARVRVLTAPQIAARLDDYLSLLTGGSRTASPRQKTLRSTLDWSYDLLGPPERLLLARLSVFAGGWTLAAAEAVCSDNGVEDSEVLDLLTGLVDKSLVVYEERGDGQGHLRLLETVRQYAKDRLQESGASEEMQGRAASWFLALVEEAEPQMPGPEEAIWLERLETEHDNLRASLSWYDKSAAGSEACLRLAEALWWFWMIRGHYAEGRQWLGQALERTQAPGEPEGQESSAGREALTRRAKALVKAGKLACNQDDYTAERPLYEEALTIRRRLDDQAGIANSLHHLSEVAGKGGDFIGAKAFLDEALILRRRLGDQAGIAHTLEYLALLAHRKGDYAAAQALYEEGLIIYRRLGQQQDIANSLEYLGSLASTQGDHALARVLNEESVAIWRRLGKQNGIAYSLVCLGSVVALSGDYTSAHGLLEESLILYRHLGHQSGIAFSLTNLGFVAVRQGDYAGAQAVLEEGLTLYRQLGYQSGISACLEEIADIMQGQKQSSRAVRLWAAALSLHESIGSPRLPVELEKLDKAVASVREALGEDAFFAAWDAGRAMTPEQAVEYALGEATATVEEGVRPPSPQ